MKRLATLAAMALLVLAPLAPVEAAKPTEKKAKPEAVYICHFGVDEVDTEGNPVDGHYMVKRVSMNGWTHGHINHSVTIGTAEFADTFLGVVSDFATRPLASEACPADPV